ncbi:Tn3 family transposase [Streptomyces alfalfae]
MPPQGGRRRSTGSGNAATSPTTTLSREKNAESNALLTNAVVFPNAMSMAEIVRQLYEEGWEIDPEDLAHILP